MIFDSEKKDLSEFAWRKKDFIFYDEDVPQLLINDNIHTYGEVISDSEIIDWLLETSKVFRLLMDTKKDLYDKLYQEYLADIKYLSMIGRIEKDQLLDLKDIINLEV